MIDEILTLERESDAPADWQDEMILVRDGRGKIFEVAIPDDEGVAEDA